MTDNPTPPVSAGAITAEAVAAAIARLKRAPSAPTIAGVEAVLLALTAERDRLKVERDTAVRNCQELANETLASLAREKNSPACVAERRANAVEARAAELEAALKQAYQDLESNHITAVRRSRAMNTIR